MSDPKTNPGSAEHQSTERYEIDVAPGKHRLECAYESTEMHSTQNAVLPLMAEPARQYVVKARKVKQGFWTELGKAFQSTVWPAKMRP